MRYHLVKRNPDLNATKGKRRVAGQNWIVQTALNKKPIGHDVAIGDVVYCYEVGYAVWAKGVVKAKTLYDPIISVEKFLDLVSRKSQDSFQYENKFWWGGSLLFDKVWPALSQSNKSLYVLEVKVDLERLDDPIFLAKEYNSRQSWRSLSGELSTKEKLLKLDKKIPSSLKLKIFEEYNLLSDAHYFDVDHVVPASLGGPGNIEENLVPLGSGINRSKGNQVPAGLFCVAQNMGFYKGTLPMGKGHLKDSLWKDKAINVIQRVNSAGVEKAKEFYGKVKITVYPNLLIDRKTNESPCPYCLK